MVLYFVWAGLAALGLLCGVVWYNGGSVVGADQGMLLALTETGGLTEMIAVLLVDVILALTDGILLAFALHYFRTEQADGTPFTKRGADEIRRLGIRTIVLPLVAAILAATVHGVFSSAGQRRKRLEQRVQPDHGRRADPGLPRLPLRRRAGGEGRIKITLPAAPNRRNSGNT